MGPATEQAQSGVFLGGRRGQAGPVSPSDGLIPSWQCFRLYFPQPGLDVPSSRPITWYQVRHHLRSILMSLVASTVAQ